jgi:hypothetical protein
VHNSQRGRRVVGKHSLHLFADRSQCLRNHLDAADDNAVVVALRTVGDDADISVGIVRSKRSTINSDSSKDL